MPFRAGSNAARLRLHLRFSRMLDLNRGGESRSGQVSYAAIRVQIAATRVQNVATRGQNLVTRGQTSRPASRTLTQSW
jgi:hypothetical protein